MGAQSQAQLGSTRQQGRGEVERDAVELVPEHPAHSHIPAGHQRQRRQEVLAELLVRDPRRIRGQPLERQVVDEHRLDAPELDVVRGGVLERPALREAAAWTSEGQERRVLELPERPLIGIADEWHHLGPDDRGGSVVEGVFERGVLPAHELSLVRRAAC